MTVNVLSALRLAGAAMATVIIAVSALWGAFALWYQAPGGHVLKSVFILLWIGFGVTLLIALWQGRAAIALIAFVVAFGCLVSWWRLIPPSNDRIWADDVAQIATGTIDGNRVTLHNVRNFDWRGDTDYTQRWETRQYNLDRLQSVDMIMSYWSSAAIAHMLISFGFDEGEHVVFSVEIRREKTKSFSEIGGFFKDFELSIIAADERDVIRVRTNVRGEEDYLYRVRMPLSAMRSLFIGYISEANSLVRTPRFYNTITVNCTTLVYQMMKRIVGYLPLDYRVMLTGYLPEYVYRVNGLDMRYPLETLRTRGRITDRAKQSDHSDAFSVEIRRGIPAIDPKQLPPELP